MIFHNRKKNYIRKLLRVIKDDLKYDGNINENQDDKDVYVGDRVEKCKFKPFVRDLLELVLKYITYDTSNMAVDNKIMSDFVNILENYEGGQKKCLIKV